MNDDERSALEANERLLKAIDAGDWATYTSLCDARITCFEPEAGGNLVSGLPFHKFYFDLPASGTPRQSSISSPSVRVNGDVALVCYIRLVQKLDAQGAPVTATVEETRLWERQQGQWKHTHFHRSAC
jgi:calcium/calmodulin-dependent protein kinase (CaM kinase) II